MGKRTDVVTADPEKRLVDRMRARLETGYWPRVQLNADGNDIIDAAGNLDIPLPSLSGRGGTSFSGGGGRSGGGGASASWGSPHRLVRGEAARAVAGSTSTATISSGSS